MIGRASGTRAAKQAGKKRTKFAVGSKQEAEQLEKHKQLRAEMEEKKREWARQMDANYACDYPDCKERAFQIDYFSTVHQHRFTMTVCQEHAKAINELRNVEGAIDTTEYDKLMALPEFKEIEK